MALAVLEPLFRSCDGHLDGERLRELSAQMGIADDAIDAILEDLDQDGDGKFSLQDFVGGFSDFLLTSSPPLEEEKVPEEREDDVTNKGAWELWDSILDDEVQKEREKVQHERHLQSLEEELTNQMKETQMQVKRKAAEEVEEERKLFRKRMSLEAERLQRHLALVEKRARKCPRGSARARNPHSAAEQNMFREPETPRHKRHFERKMQNEIRSADNLPEERFSRRRLRHGQRNASSDVTRVNGCQRRPRNQFVCSLPSEFRKEKQPLLQ